MASGFTTVFAILSLSATSCSSQGTPYPILHPPSYVGPSQLPHSPVLVRPVPNPRRSPSSCSSPWRFHSILVHDLPWFDSATKLNQPLLGCRESQSGPWLCHGDGEAARPVPSTTIAPSPPSSTSYTIHQTNSYRICTHTVSNHTLDWPPPLAATRVAEKLKETHSSSPLHACFLGHGPSHIHRLNPLGPRPLCVSLG